MDSGRGSPLLAMGNKLKNLNMAKTLDLIPPSEMILLAEMANLKLMEPDKLIKVSDIAQALDISLPAVSRTLNRLEEKRLIERLTDKGDRRNVCITLTDTGEEAVRDNINKIKEFLDRALLSLSDDEITQLTTLFDKMYEAIKAELSKIEQEKETNRIC